MGREVRFTPGALVAVNIPGQPEWWGEVESYYFGFDLYSVKSAEGASITVPPAYNVGFPPPRTMRPLTLLEKLAWAAR